MTKPASRTPAKKPRTTKKKVVAAPPPPVVLEVSSLRKSFAGSVAVDDVDLTVRRGSVFGFVGPNGAGKTTTLSMITGLLRPDAGSVVVGDADVWRNPVEAKRIIGVLPDRMRLFDRLTGAQMLYYCAVLHGLDRDTARRRTDDLAVALGLDGSLDRPVRDYSIGMVKKISLAAAMIHSPRLLVLDEPFESVDPVSTALAVEVLKRFAAAGGTVVLSSHNMALVERVCDSVAVIVEGRILASGSLDEVRGSSSLEERFVELAGGRVAVEGLEWLTTFSD
ncbi:ABC transporter ATP-binding protein [Microcella sp.]|uniref:ABC transporter ATP-binding protein n=1 Tax=Microcella sp. TaxID=1913979 RepID=UPI0026176638|nr:ABC transporter ATP-binding protein [Microcella sp.]